ncbi:MAG: hypothetical protein L0215_06745 [Gemmataceae bacterium]|nr:hypothetical protein [Gemmataceae bacterium]
MERERRHELEREQQHAAVEARELYLVRRLDPPRFPVWIRIYDADLQQRMTVYNAVQQAALAIERAAFLLENFFPEIQRALPDNLPISLLWRERPGDHLRAYLAQLRTVLHRLRNPDSSIDFEIEDTPGGGRATHGYVRPGGYRIHLNPRFFESSSEEQAHTIVWELGRLVVRIDGQSGNYAPENIQIWTDIIFALNNNYNDRIFREIINRPEFRLGPDGPRLLTPE